MPTNPNTAEPQKPRRRWFQFRLRTLLIGVAIIAMLCPLGVRLVRQWQESRRTQDTTDPYPRRGGSPDYGPSTDRLRNGPGSDAGIVGPIILDQPPK
jgi:hypothetical protein